MFVGVAINLTADLLSSAYPVALFAGGEIGVWYDPSDLTTMFQDNLGATPVTAAGQTVGRILDKSGRGNHATQATLAQRPTYQIDSTGRPYLSFDGVDDGMVTGTITPGTDKVQVFAGVRKLSDAAVGSVVEFSANVNTNSGSLWLAAPVTVGGANYYFTSKGTVASAGVTASSRAAPITSVLTGIGDISGDVATLRVNGTLISTSSSDQGTGNYLAYPLYIGRRGGVAAPVNGRIYSVIVRFGSNLTTGQITSTESWVNGKTGAY
jgi:hypothetical protein